MIELNKIYNEDCLEGMKRIPDGSVDCVICDLPYGVLNKNNANVQWDRIIPFEPLWEQYNRIIKDNGAIILFAQGMFTAQLIMSNPKMWRYNLVWDKVLKTGFLNANRMPLRQHEDICVFYKKLPTYNQQMEKCKPRQKNHRRHKKNGESSYTLTNRCYGKFNDVPDMITDEKFPTSIIREPKQHIKGKSYHPTEKPVGLLRYLIRTYTNENDVVLDNTMGSGSTAIACIREKRNFIGFELNKEYYDKACKRIKLEQAQLTLF